MTRWLPALCLLLCAARAACAQPALWAGVKLVDAQGTSVTAATLSGHPVLMHFVFTTCSSTCPLQVHDLSLVHAALAEPVRRQLRLVSVSVDPLQDTPASLAAFARRLGADRAGWQFVTGAPAMVERLVDRVDGMAARPSPRRPEDHRTSLYLFDAGGRLVQRYSGTPIDRKRLVAEITQVVQMGAVRP